MFTTPMENCRRSRGRYTVNKNARLASQVLMSHAEDLVTQSGTGMTSAEEWESQRRGVQGD